jgi:hypothetical protein
MVAFFRVLTVPFLAIAVANAAAGPGGNGRNVRPRLADDRGDGAAGLVPAAAAPGGALIGKGHFAAFG